MAVFDPSWFASTQLIFPMTLWGHNYYHTFRNNGGFKEFSGFLLDSTRRTQQKTENLIHNSDSSPLCFLLDTFLHNLERLLHSVFVFFLVVSNFFHFHFMMEGLIVNNIQDTEKVEKENDSSLKMISILEQICAFHNLLVHLINKYPYYLSYNFIWQIGMANCQPWGQYKFTSLTHFAKLLNIRLLKPQEQE